MFFSRQVGDPHEMFHVACAVRLTLVQVRPGGVLCGHDFYKTPAYTRAILASVPEGKALYLGPLPFLAGAVMLSRVRPCILHEIPVQEHVCLQESRKSIHLIQLFLRLRS